MWKKKNNKNWKSAISKVIKSFFTNADQLITRLETAYIVLFKPQRRWLFLQIERSELKKLLMKQEYSMNLKYHKLNSNLSVELMEEVVKKRHKFEKPSQKLVHDALLEKKNLN